MIPFPELSEQLESAAMRSDCPEAAARSYLEIGEAVLENWAESRDLVPTSGEKEGFRLLALHRQGAKGEPSFNACRETCREVAYHYNLVTMEPNHPDVAGRLKMMEFVTQHLLLFVSGKMQVEKLGEFCCASRPLRSEPETLNNELKEPNHA